MTHSHVFDSAHWWDDHGPFRILHEMMPFRVRWVLENLSVSQRSNSQPLSGLSLLDVGCGAGLLCEPLARLGAHVVGLDQSVSAIECARRHCAKDLDVVYNVGDVMHWEAPFLFDAVLLMETLEHVDCPFSVLQRCLRWLKPGGVVMGSTPNRTWFSYISGIIIAEKVCQMVPKGTHEWSAFIKPTEMRLMLERLSCSSISMRGLLPLPWRFSDNFSLNYFFSGKHS